MAFVLEGEQPYGRIFETVGVQRMRRILETADHNGLGEEADYLIDNLSASQRKQLRRGSRN